MIYPILKKHNEALARGYAGARIVEGVLFIVNTIAILTLLKLSQEFVKAGAQDSFYYQTLGTVLLAAGDWAYLLGLGLAFTLSALILNFVLYQSKLIPQWLSSWGIAVQEMVFAVWLIVKGFNPSASIPGLPKQI